MSLPALLVRTLALFAVGALILALGSVRQPAPVRKRRVARLLFFFAMVHGVIGIAAMGTRTVAFDPGVIVWIFLVAAACVGFSLVVGQWLGRRPLAARLGARLTVEGTAGGAIAAISAAAWLRGLTPFGVERATVMGALIAVVVTGAAIVLVVAERR